MNMDAETQTLESFEPGVLDAEFGTRVLGDYRKASALDGAISLDRYALETDVRLSGTNFGQRFRDKYFDATYNLCLTRDGALVASLGFDLDGDDMNVWQLQGVRGQAPALRSLRWERALLDRAVEWARSSAVSTVYVASADHVHWAADPGHLDPARAKLRYDVTAKRCGFRRNLDDYYELSLTDR
jgi:hypothetical protein